MQPTLSSSLWPLSSRVVARAWCAIAALGVVSAGFAARAETKTLAPREPPLARTTVSLGLGYQTSFRWFRQSESTTGENRAYDATFLQGAAASVLLYPAASADGWIADLGVKVEYARTLSFTSYPPAQYQPSMQGVNVAGNAQPQGALAPLDTRFQRWSAGLRYRFAPAERKKQTWEVGVAASYGRWSFDFTTPSGEDREVPLAEYHRLELSIDAARRFGPISLLGELGYQQLLSVAPLGDRLPAAPMLSGDVRAGIAFHLARSIAIELLGHYTLAWFHLYPLAGRNDANATVADHTFDVYLGPRISF